MKVIDKNKIKARLTYYLLKKQLSGIERKALEYMIDEKSPQLISVKLHLPSYQGGRRALKLYFKEKGNFSDEEIEDIFINYSRLLFYPILILPLGLKKRDFLNVASNLIKKMNYNQFLKFSPNPTSILTDYIHDSDFMFHFFKEMENGKKILDVEVKYHVFFDVTSTLDQLLLKNCYIKYSHGTYYDTKLNEEIKFLET